MGSSGGSDAPEYSSSVANTGLWGTSYADKNGTYYAAPGWMSSVSKNVTSKINPTINALQNKLNSSDKTLSNIMSGNYLNDENFKVYKSQFDKNLKDSYDTSVLGTLSDRNLMRSSGMQALNNNFTQSMQDKLIDLMDAYYNRQVNNYNLQNSNLGAYTNQLANLLNTENALYNYMTGATGLSTNQANNVSNYNLNATSLNNANNAQNNAMRAGLASNIANVGLSLL